VHKTASYTTQTPTLMKILNITNNSKHVFASKTMGFFFLRTMHLDGFTGTCMYNF